jgi:hypothetical protein
MSCQLPRTIGYRISVVITLSLHLRANKQQRISSLLHNSVGLIHFLFTYEILKIGPTNQGALLQLSFVIKEQNYICRHADIGQNSLYFNNYILNSCRYERLSDIHKICNKKCHESQKLVVNEKQMHVLS